MILEKNVGVYKGISLYLPPTRFYTFLPASSRERLAVKISIHKTCSSLINQKKKNAALYIKLAVFHPSQTRKLRTKGY
jgi:hypothetical protein